MSIAALVTLYATIYEAYTTSSRGPCVKVLSHRRLSASVQCLVYRGQATESAEPEIEIVLGRLRGWRSDGTCYDPCAKTFLFAVALAAPKMS